MKKQGTSKYNGKFFQNQKFDQWTIFDGTVLLDERGRTFVTCVCSCGTTTDVSCRHLLTGRSTRCKTCDVTNRKLNENPHWEGTGHVSRTYFSQVSESSAKNNIPFKIDANYMNNLYANQSGTCAMTNCTLTAANSSLVPIDKKYGYVENNVMWVSNDIKPLINKIGTNKFIELCTNVAKKYNNLKE